MKKAYIFPGQGSQFVGMGKDLYESSPLAKSLFEEANAILGFAITEVMFSGDEEALKQTRVTQPAIFVHSVIQRQVLGDAFKPDMVALCLSSQWSTNLRARLAPRSQTC